MLIAHLRFLELQPPLSRWEMIVSSLSLLDLVHGPFLQESHLSAIWLLQVEALVARRVLMMVQVAGEQVVFSPEHSL